MEENSRKGPGVFYAVVGVATLVVAIIGATFAFFSASTGQQGSGTVQGQTQNISGASLTLTVNKIDFHSSNNTAYDTLVPAYFGTCAAGDVSTYSCTANGVKVTDPTHLTANEVSSMISRKCANDGFTGCHMYTITFSTTQSVTNANLLLDLSLTGSPTNTTQWGYALFTSTGTPASGTPGTITLLTGNGIPGSIGSGINDLDIYNNGSLTAGNSVVYYLVVYVNDTDAAQNATGSNYVVGGYTGSLELQALGGKVRAEFVQPGAQEPNNDNISPVDKY